MRMRQVTFNFVFAYCALSPPVPDLLYLQVMPGGVQSPFQLQDLLRHLIMFYYVYLKLCQIFDIHMFRSCHLS